MGLRWGRSWLSSPIGGWSRDYPTIDTDASNASPRARRHSPQIQLLCYTLMDKFGGSSAVQGHDHGRIVATPPLPRARPGRDADARRLLVVRPEHLRPWQPDRLRVG